MVLYRIESSDMTNDGGRGVDSERRASHISSTAVKCVRRDINTIPNHAEWRTVEHPFTCILPAGEKMGRYARDSSLAHYLERILNIPVLAAAVRVCHSHNSAMLGGCCKWICAHTVDVRVYDMVGEVFKKTVDFVQIMRVKWVASRDMINVAAKRLNFVTIGKMPLTMAEEVELHLPPVHIPVHVHHERLKTAPVHPGDNL